MEWNCTATEERLSDYIEQQLGAGEAAALEAHVKTCANCAQMVERVGGVVNEMRGLEMVEPPAGLHKRIMHATLGPPPSLWRRLFGWMPAFWHPRFAIGLATVAACCIVVVQAGGVTPGKLRRANLNPVDMLRAANRQAHLTYARGAKFVNDLRVVYEIQSRLEPEQRAEEAPARKRSQQSKPQSSYPQQKSETQPGRRAARIDTLFAMLITSGPTLAQRLWAQMLPPDWSPR